MPHEVETSMMVESCELKKDCIGQMNRAIPCVNLLREKV